VGPVCYPSLGLSTAHGSPSDSCLTQGGSLANGDEAEGEAAPAPVAPAQGGTAKAAAESK